MPTIARHCPQCKKYSILEAADNKTLTCPSCQNLWGNVSSVQGIFERCPMCTCRQFYTVKDFNQIIGFLVMGIGIVLVPKTFGLSLPVFALIDWLIYRYVPTLVACYRCGGEFRGFETPKQLKAFMHHIGLKYDKYR